MFWMKTIKPKDKYCVCQSSWKYFRIVKVDVASPILTISITVDNGCESELLSLRKGESLPHFWSSILFEFNVNDHAKIVVKGGSITLLGVSYEGIRRGNSNRFNELCIFNDFNKTIDIDAADIELLDKLSEIEQNDKH